MSGVVADATSTVADEDASLDDLETQISENLHVGAALRAGHAELKSLTIWWTYAASVALTVGWFCAWFLFRNGLSDFGQTLLSLGSSGSLFIFVLCASEVFRFLGCLARANIALAANESGMAGATEFVAAQRAGK